MMERKQRKDMVEAKARSIRRKRPFVVAGAAAAVHYLCLVATVTCGVLFVEHPRLDTVLALIGSLGLAVASWIIGYFKRRAAMCPLCNGTPLLVSGALPHVKAVRIPPFNHGVSAVLSLVFTQRFTCMYCGCRFDMLKDSKHPPSAEG